MQLSASSGSSRFLTFSIVLFLALDALMLGLNFSITRSVSGDALIINLAGRQRMLSQRMTKAVFQIDLEQLEASSSQALLQQFLGVHELFSQTLLGFEKGGVVRDAELNEVVINPISLDEVKGAIVDANQLLAPITAEVERLRGSQESPQGSIAALRALLAENNDGLLRLMNDITVAVEKSSRAQTERLRLIQSVTFLLAMLNFAYIIKLFRDGVRQTAEIVDTLSELLQGTNAAMIVFDQQGRVNMVNRSAANLYGCSESGLLGVEYDRLFATEQEDTYAVSPITGLKTPVEKHERILSREGRELRVITLVDISQYLEVQRSLEQAATLDPLTGLYNRSALNRELTTKVESARREDSRFACVFVDLDGFKAINDSLGHEAGDQLLIAIAKRLKGTLRDSDRAFRFGGDEFIVLVDLYDQSHTIDLILDRIHQLADRPFQLEGNADIDMGLSAGAAIFPDDAQSAEDLLNHSDQMMYRQKRNGRSADPVPT